MLWSLLGFCGFDMWGKVPTYYIANRYILSILLLLTQ